MEVEVGRSTQSIQQLGLWAIEVLYIYIISSQSSSIKKIKIKQLVQPLRTNKRANNNKTTPQKLG